jgi:4-alpha-glucanotransferase
MRLERSSGILLHPTSLPGAYGIGSLDRQAFTFVNWLKRAGQKLWQILPLGPTGYGDSPYASFSSFAGNPLMIDLESLVKSGYLEEKALASAPIFPPGKVDFGRVIAWKLPLLTAAAERFLASGRQAASFEDFKARESAWLDDYALFMSIKAVYDAQAAREGVHGAMWANYWPSALALRESAAVAEWKKAHAGEIAVQEALQYFFFTQWLALKAYANEQGIRIIGDIPIFVAADSADIWAHRELFLLDERGAPLSVAGVPPDYFSPTGQLWGNPLYDWKRMARDGYAWWIERIRSTLRLVDWVRIDHFRGFEAFWEIPYGSATAERGRWTKGPGAEFFETVRRALGELPILAEDLGFITEEVRALRKGFGFPGMKILQFAFDASEGGKGIDVANEFLPHNFAADCVVYTGTHDNDTTRGWVDSAAPEELGFARLYTGCGDGDLVASLIRLALASVAAFAVFPMQDLLGLGGEARMNVPSTVGGNWNWRLEGKASEGIARSLAELTLLFGRDIRAKSVISG